MVLDIVHRVWVLAWVGRAGRGMLLMVTSVRRVCKIRGLGEVGVRSVTVEAVQVGMEGWGKCVEKTLWSLVRMGSLSAGM